MPPPVTVPCLGQNTVPKEPDRFLLCDARGTVSENREAPVSLSLTYAPLHHLYKPGAGKCKADFLRPPSALTRPQSVCSWNDCKLACAEVTYEIGLRLSPAVCAKMRKRNGKNVLRKSSCTHWGRVCVSAGFTPPSCPGGMDVYNRAELSPPWGISDSLWPPRASRYGHWRNPSLQRAIIPKKPPR